MRAALDYLIWQLVIVNGKTPAPSNMFPICRDVAGFVRHRGRGSLQGLSPSDEALVDSLQPYHRGQPDCDLAPLWILNQLANIDKHRMPTLAVLVASSWEVEIKPKDGSQGGFHVNAGKRGTGQMALKDGAQFFGYSPHAGEFLGPDFTHYAKEMDVNGKGSM